MILDCVIPTFLYTNNILCVRQSLLYSRQLNEVVEDVAGQGGICGQPKYKSHILKQDSHHDLRNNEILGFLNSRPVETQFSFGHCG